MGTARNPGESAQDYVQRRRDEVDASIKKARRDKKMARSTARSHVGAYRKWNREAEQAKAARRTVRGRMIRAHKAGKAVDVAGEKARYDILSAKYRDRAKKAQAQLKSGRAMGMGEKNWHKDGRAPRGSKAPARQPDPQPQTPAPQRGSNKSYSAPAVSSKKTPKSRAPSVKQQVRSAAEDKKRYLALQKNRASQSAHNYGKKQAGQNYKKGQKIYNDQTREIKKSRYSWASHKAAMKRRGKTASQASYAKFKRYNGI